MLATSTPTFSDFNPFVIPYQGKVIDDLFHNFDYEIGAHEVLLSGSVGSAKSILLAHVCIKHCIENPNARVLIGRKSMPDLKQTIFQKILEHLEGSFQLDLHYFVNWTSAKIRFLNGSEIISRSWADKRYTKVRSLELSAAIIEELSENNEEDKRAYEEIKMRVGRLPHIKTQNFILCATNPDSPSSWVFRYFIDTNSPTRHVYYSVTTDNPFLPTKYIEQLKKDLDPKQAERMIYGKWVEILKETVYHAYDKRRNYRAKSYKIDLKHPIHVSWDFNIGHGKPLSCALFQFIDDKMHIFNECVVEGMRTQDSCEELAGRGLLDHKTSYIINGDATGRRRDTRNVKSDYDIIKKYFANYETDDGRRLDYKISVPVSNGPIRKRHNLVNSYLYNSLKEVRLIVYKDAPTADKGLRLTQLKKGGSYIEDDSEAHPWQHITTAIGYGLRSSVKGHLEQQTIQL